MKVKSVGLINERNGWLGLSVWDICGLGYLLLFLHLILSRFSLEWLAFLLVGAATFALISIRLKSRKKTIRDFLRFKLSPRVKK